MSGKAELESRMVFRREGVPMGLPGLDEWHIQQTDTASVRAARKCWTIWRDFIVFSLFLFNFCNFFCCFFIFMLDILQGLW